MANSTTSHSHRYTVEPGYNDIGLCDTSSIASDIVVPVNSSLLIITSIEYSELDTIKLITLYSSVKTTIVYKDKIFSPFHYVITEF
jgi:hypothetical protein